MAKTTWEQEFGGPDPLGATWIAADRAYNFALYSRHATEVTLLCYRKKDLHQPVFTFSFDVYRNRTGRVWHARIRESELNGALYYAYRVNGPTPGSGYDYHHFDPDKILLDPYARAVHFPPGHSREAACQPGRNDGRAPLGRLSMEPDAFNWEGDKPVRRSGDLIVYEIHVRGFTQNPNSGVSGDRRGTYLGIVDKIPYLRDLGVTAVELMPVFQFDPVEGNYWGYMTLNFFAPHQHYSASRDACGQRDEFREMVKKLHQNGIEVLLDVVYNHTTEGDLNGPAYSFKGIDNSTYYMIRPDNHSEPYQNFTLCGNTIHTANATVRRLIVDSLRYWVEEMHVDGFRFDLASVLARSDDGSLNEEAPLFSEIAADPVLNRVRLIAEQWDMQRAKFPGRVWGQWNGQYRDCLRKYVRSDPGQVGELMSRLYGSCDLLPDGLPNSFHPAQSVNYITSHDGFTLADLVSYNRRTDRDDDSYGQLSWDCGYHGVDNVPDHVAKLREQQVKNFCALLMLSNGTPMVRMGDELMQSQRGHSDPYNVDSPLTWLDWGLVDSHPTVLRFFKKMIAFRKAHPSLSRVTYWREDVRWYGTEGSYDMAPESRTLAFYLDGRAVNDADLYVLINSYWDPLSFRIQEGSSGQWKRLVDTAREAPDDILDDDRAASIGSDSYTVQGRSVVVLVRT